jgi:hypothetical protein
MTPPIATHAIRDEIAGQRAQLTQSGARCPKRVGLHLIGRVASLCDALDQARIELRQRETYQDLYQRLVVDYNGLIAVLRDLDIEIYQPSGSDAWHWSYGDANGSAPTVVAAAMWALAAAGAVSSGYARDDAVYAAPAAAATERDAR